MKTIPYLVLLAAVLTGCSLPEAEPLAEDSTYTLRMSPLTKGSLVDENALDNPQIRIFGLGVLLSDGGGGTVRLNRNARYDVYAWANCDLGDGNSQESLREAVISYSKAQDVWDARPSVPMSYMAEGITPPELDLLDGVEDHSISIPLERLFARVDVSVVCEPLLLDMFPDETVGGNSFGISLVSLRAGGCAGSIGIFDPSLDYPSPDASSTLVDQSDGAMSMSVYFPESLRGDLLPENDNPWRKNAQELLSKGVDPETVPYLELTVRFSSYHYRMNVVKTYRCYPGADDCRNFDLWRGRVYSLCLSLSYDGTSVTGEWKCDGADDSRSRYLSMFLYDYEAAPGETVYIGTEYEYYYLANECAHFLCRQNGYVVGLESQMASWHSSGTLPEGFTRVEADRYVQCSTCHHMYPGCPEAGGTRHQWARENVGSSGLSVRCRWCGSVWFDITDGSSRNSFNSASDGEYAPGCRFLSLPPCTSYTIPSDAVEGSSIEFVCSWRDGRLQASESLKVGYGTGAVVHSSGGSGLWIAQSSSVSVCDWPEASMGTDPSFTFTLSCADGVASLTSVSSREVVLNALGPGDYTVTVRFNGAVVGETTGTVQAPLLGYPDDWTSADYISEGLRISPGGEDTRFTAPVYLIRSRGSLVRYTSYDEALFESLLGTPALSMEDGSYVSVTDDGFPSSIALGHLYSGGRLVDFRNSSARLDRVRVSSRHPAVEPVYLPVRMNGLLSGVSSAVPTHSRPIMHGAPAEGDWAVSLPLSDWSLMNSSHLRMSYGGEDVMVGNADPSAQGRSPYGYLRYGSSLELILDYADTWYGNYEVYYRMHGGSETYDLPLARIRKYGLWRGTIKTRVTDMENIDENGFFYIIHVSLDNMAESGLFRPVETAVLPTEGMWDPEDIWYNDFYCGHSAEFYREAHHVYEGADSYRCELNRNHRLSFFSMNSNYQKGFGEEKYRQWNLPLFRPVASPVVTGGAEWRLVSDSGGTARWASDDFRECELTYTAWPR